MNHDILDYLADRVADALLAKQGDNKSSMGIEVRYYTVDEICRMLHVSKATYYRHKDMGYITPAKYVGRKPLFTQESIDVYLNHFSS